MELKCQHLVVRTTDINIAKDFYISKLGLEVLEETKNFFAAKAGDVRLSFFEGYERFQAGEDVGTGVSIIFRVDNLEMAIEEAKQNGIKLKGEIIDIPNFHKFQEIEEPDGNIVYLAEYKVEPI